MLDVFESFDASTLNEAQREAGDEMVSELGRLLVQDGALSAQAVENLRMPLDPDVTS